MILATRSPHHRQPSQLAVQIPSRYPEKQLRSPKLFEVIRILPIRLGNNPDAQTQMLQPTPNNPRAKRRMINVRITGNENDIKFIPTVIAASFFKRHRERIFCKCHRRGFTSNPLDHIFHAEALRTAKPQRKKRSEKECPCEMGSSPVVQRGHLNNGSNTRELARSRELLDGVYNRFRRKRNSPSLKK